MRDTAATPHAIDSWLQPDESLDLTNCDREAIHIPSSIQPHGVLLALGPEGELLQHSENCQAFTGVEPEALAAALRELRPEPQASRSSPVALREISTLTLGKQLYTVASHRIDAAQVFELEEAVPERSLLQLLPATNRLSSELGEARSEREAYGHAARVVRELTGYDRVMAYAFDEEGHGSVVAEECDEGAQRFLGMRFPATDIPKQARRLYVLELTRQIADVDYAPVPLTPLESPLTGRPLNMAFCQLRSVSPIHVEYLQNMKVAASFSISVVIDGELVALIACHHNSPRRLDLATRAASELVGRLLSEHMARRRFEAQRRLRDRLLSAQVELLCQLGDAATLSADNPAWSHAFDFVEAHAFVASLGGELHIEPNAAWSDEARLPPRVAAIGEQLKSRGDACVRVIEALGDIDPDSSGGLLFVPVPELGWVAWYREPVERVISWAGEQRAGVQKTLTPRRSFALWREKVQGKCERWREHEIEMAELLHRGLSARFVGVVEKSGSFERVLRQTREYVRYLEERNHALSVANQDLRQYTQVTSHDFRAPLRTIRSFVPLLREQLGPGLSDDGDQWMKFVENAADTLSRLQDGLWSYTTVSRHLEVEDLDTHALVRDLCDALAVDLSDVQITLGQLPPLRGVRVQIEALFRNLLDNASKFRDPLRKLRITIDGRLVSGDPVFRVSDNGIGFPPSAAARVFDLFSRVHPDHRDGTGLGLAMCRRIAQHHQGWIRADSEPGLGSTFEFKLATPREFSTPDGARG